MKNFYQFSPLLSKIIYILTKITKIVKQQRQDLINFLNKNLILSIKENKTQIVSIPLKSGLYVKSSVALLKLEVFNSFDIVYLMWYNSNKP